ncbi:MAG TPA: DUF4838 domain-containing protein [Armatimonadota bacterium]|nr:DUF4838 domain-containing protein [Armatimonadota bacterium]
MTDSSYGDAVAPGAGSHSTAAAPSLLLADDGRSDYRIVLSASASPSEKHAAQELQMFLERICGARLPIVTDEETLGEHEIILGDNAHLREIGEKVDLEGLGDEGFVIRTAPPHLVIAGGRLRGTMYGVYTFLEDHLGCRWFTPEVSRIPKLERLEVGDISDRQIPVLEGRDVYFQHAFDADWAARNRVNTGRAVTKEHGAKAEPPWPYALFYLLIPPDKYFASHPEWFSQVDGERTHIGRFQRAQLCLTNEGLIQEAIKIAKAWLREHPQATVISVMQNDGAGGWCECNDCAALEAREGGAHSAPIIYFVNRIAEAIADEHPGVAVSTLAYWYSQRPPKTLKPRPNVIVRMCTNQCCRSHAFANEKCEQNAPLREDLRHWFELTQRIYVWDYVVNFRHYLLPFANLGRLGPNIRFFVNHGVRGIFAQGSGDSPHSDLSPLKAYVLAKLMWNPDCNEERAVDEFLAAYFGAAAQPIRAYLDSLEREIEADDLVRLHLSSFVQAVEASYLTPELLARAARLFDEAERLVADDPERRLRVQAARLSLDYVKLWLAARVHALVSAEDRRLPLGDWYRQAAEEFFSVAERAGVTHIRESSRSESTMDDFRRQLATITRTKEGEDVEIT